MAADQLRIESPQGRPMLIYRIHGGNVEVCVPAVAGASRFSGDEDSWRPLSVRELGAHLAQNPALALWLHAHVRSRHTRFGDAEDESSAA